MENVKVSIYRDFSSYCGGRTRRTGSWSAEELYETILRPKFTEALGKGVNLEVDLDDTAGYAASFLDEAFGCRMAKEFGSSVVLNNLVLISTDEPYLIEDIKLYILEADEVIKTTEE